MRLSAVVASVCLAATSVSPGIDQALGAFVAADRTILAGKTAVITLQTLNGKDDTLSKRVSTLGPRRGLFLTFVGYEVTIHPAGTYEVILGTTADASLSPERKLGVVAFRSLTGGTKVEFASFDITVLAKTLLDARRLGEPTVVTLVPSSSVKSDASVTVHRIEIIEQPTR